MRLPAPGSHVRRALELVAENGREGDILCTADRRQEPELYRRCFSGHLIVVGPKTWDTLKRKWGMLRYADDPALGYVYLDDDLVRRLLAAKKRKSILAS